MPNTIEGAEYAIRGIFSDHFSFEIPRYQRPYAWTTEHTSEMLDDFLSFMGTNGTEVEDLDPYFIGSIVLIKKKDSPKAQVVDGQQRLTTLTMLLAVLRRTIQDSKFRDGLTSFLYAQGNVVSGIPDEYRLTLRRRDAKFFQNYVQNDHGLAGLRELEPAQITDSQQRIRENTLLLLDEVSKLDDERRKRLAQFIVQRCYLVVVSTPDLGSAYRIFSVLNDRGMDLSHSDILKAEIIGQIPEEKQATYTRIWEDREEELGRDDFATLFAHIRMIFRKAKARGTVLEEVREYVQPSKDPQGFIEGTLVPLADAYYIVKNRDYESSHHAARINTLLDWLNQIDNTDWVPPAIEYLRHHKNRENDLLKFLIDLERLAAGMMVIRANINYRLERYGKLLTAIQNGENLFSPNSPLQLSKEECRVVTEALNGDLYLVRRIRKYVLLRLDSTLSEGTARYDYSTLSIEHVLPQNPPEGSQWLKWFPTQELRDRYTHLISNLVLLSRRKNSMAQNYDFEKKKQRYFTTREGTSPFALTTTVIETQLWKPTVLDARQERLVDKLVDLWRLDEFQE